MSPGRAGVQHVKFGDDALAYVHEELQAAAREFGGPLAARLVGSDLGEPFGLLSPAARSSAHLWRHGGIDDGSSDRHLAAAIARWLGGPDIGHSRLMALEEPLGRYGDESVDPRTLHCGPRVYYTAGVGDDQEHVGRVFKRLTGYPGVGILSRLRGAPSLRDLAPEDLGAIADTGVAALVRAWDDEGFLIVPIAGRLTPQDLS